MINLLQRYVLPAAYSILPPAMQSDAATAMLLAIALQESRLRERLQIGGPARGWWQFERSGGIAGVLSHPQSRGPIGTVLETLHYRRSGDECYRAVADNDVLAACFARCLLWTVPRALPLPTEAERAWQDYLEAWHPGKPHRETWDAFYSQAWLIVKPTEKPI